MATLPMAVLKTAIIVVFAALMHVSQGPRACEGILDAPGAVEVAPGVYQVYLHQGQQYVFYAYTCNGLILKTTHRAQFYYANFSMHSRLTDTFWSAWFIPEEYSFPLDVELYHYAGNPNITEVAHFVPSGAPGVYCLYVSEASFVYWAYSTALMEVGRSNGRRILVPIVNGTNYCSFKTPIVSHQLVRVYYNKSNFWVIFSNTTHTLSYDLIVTLRRGNYLRLTTHVQPTKDPNVFYINTFGVVVIPSANDSLTIILT